MSKFYYQIIIGLISYLFLFIMKKYAQNSMNQDYLNFLRILKSLHLKALFPGFQGNSGYTMHKKPTITPKALICKD